MWMGLDSCSPSQTMKTLNLRTQIKRSSFMNTSECHNGLDAYQVRHSVRPDLGTSKLFAKLIKN